MHVACTCFTVIIHLDITSMRRCSPEAVTNGTPVQKAGTKSMRMCMLIQFLFAFHKKEFKIIVEEAFNYKIIQFVLELHFNYL